MLPQGEDPGTGCRRFPARAAFLTAPAGGRDSAGDAVEPQPGTRALGYVGEAPPRDEEGLGDDVCRVDGAVHAAQGIAQDDVDVSGVQLLEALLPMAHGWSMSGMGWIVAAPCALPGRSGRRGIPLPAANDSPVPAAPSHRHRCVSPAGPSPDRSDRRQVHSAGSTRPSASVVLRNPLPNASEEPDSLPTVAHRAEVEQDGRRGESGDRP